MKELENFGDGFAQHMGVLGILLPDPLGSIAQDHHALTRRRS